MSGRELLLEYLRDKDRHPKVVRWRRQTHSDMLMMGFASVVEAARLADGFNKLECGYYLTIRHMKSNLSRCGHYVLIVQKDGLRV